MMNTKKSVVKCSVAGTRIFAENSLQEHIWDNRDILNIRDIVVEDMTQASLTTIVDLLRKIT
jgi:hypothetical protein